MCADTGISKSLMTDLKMGRKKGVNAETAQKIADYFDVSVGYLLGAVDQKEKSPILTEKDERHVSDEEIKAAFWGGDEDLSKEDLDEMWNDVRKFADFVKAEKKKKKGL